MAIVGAFARVDQGDVDGVRSRLEALDGVELFDLDEPGKVGLLIESPDLDAAHAMVCQVIERQEGVLGVWPVFADADPDDGSWLPSPEEPSTSTKN